jgi:hypothetical protein
MIGTISHVPSPLYYRLVRPDSLTHSDATGTGSVQSTREFAIGRRIYDECFASYKRFQAGELSSLGLPDCISHICQRRINDLDRAQLAHETIRLRPVLESVS